ncbi:MAG: hypothetical protein JWN07_300 [Hyphomicrobiales bacterium]|nr:hypothetical protein [Hyphomicrobiales bacterium]
MKKPGKAALARARALYEAGETPLAKIAATLGLSPAAFRTLRKREDWPARGAVASPPVAIAPAEAGDETLDTLALERRLVRALRREIARAESEIENTAHPGAERKARILGLLVKTLGDLRRLGAADKAQTQRGADDGPEPARDEAPRELAALREALAERIESLRGERNAG